MKYIATREGVEVLTGKGPATDKQKEMVAKLLKDFPDVRDSFEYEDYKQAPTLHTASALISAALDSHMQNLQSENGYLKYIATRPGAHCAPRMHRALGTEEQGAVRFSFGWYNTEEEADAAVTALREIAT